MEQPEGLMVYLSLLEMFFSGRMTLCGLCKPGALRVTFVKQRQWLPQPLTQNKNCLILGL